MGDSNGAQHGSSTSVIVVSSATSPSVSCKKRPLDEDGEGSGGPSPAKRPTVENGHAETGPSTDSGHTNGNDGSPRKHRTAKDLKTAAKIIVNREELLKELKKLEERDLDWDNMDKEERLDKQCDRFRKQLIVYEKWLQQHGYVEKEDEDTTRIDFGCTQLPALDERLRAFLTERYRAGEPTFIDENEFKDMLKELRDQGKGAGLPENDCDIRDLYHKVLEGVVSTMQRVRHSEFEKNLIADYAGGEDVNLPDVDNSKLVTLAVCTATFKDLVMEAENNPSQPGDEEEGEDMNSLENGRDADEDEYDTVEVDEEEIEDDEKVAGDSSAQENDTIDDPVVEDEDEDDDEEDSIEKSQEDERVEEEKKRKEKEEMVKKEEQEEGEKTVGGENTNTVNEEGKAEEENGKEETAPSPPLIATASTSPKVSSNGADPAGAAANGAAAAAQANNEVITIDDDEDDEEIDYAELRMCTLTAEKRRLVEDWLAKAEDVPAIETVDLSDDEDEGTEPGTSKDATKEAEGAANGTGDDGMEVGGEGQVKRESENTTTTSPPSLSPLEQSAEGSMRAHARDDEILVLSD